MAETNNTLFNNIGTWIGDGTPGATLNVIDDNEITIANPKRGTPFTARMDHNGAAVSDNHYQYYFAVKIEDLKGSFSIGVIKEDQCLPGWKSKGLFYNGNLTNGSAALKTSWGPRPTIGDTVGVCVSSSSGTGDGASQEDTNVLEVAFYKNQECIGTGFRLKDISGLYQPSIHVDGTAKLSLVVPEMVPFKETDKKTKPSSGVAGEWKLLIAKKEETEVAVENGGRPIVMTISPPETAGENAMMGISIKVGNVLNRRVTIIQDNGDSGSMKVGFGPCMMTMMMPPPHLRLLESFLSKMSPTDMEVIAADDDKLKLTGNGCESVWMRYTPTREAVTEY